MKRGGDEKRYTISGSFQVAVLSMMAYAGHTGVQANHTTHCAVAEQHTERETTVKKSIAVLSLTIAGALGLAAWQLQRIHLQPLPHRQTQPLPPTASAPIAPP